MSMIQIEHLTFSYPGSFDTIFEDVSLQLDTDWKLGCIGRNGRGKTTLFRLLMGQYTYSGTITSSVQFDYFPYPVTKPERLTEEVLQEICPIAEQWELMRELSFLEVEPEVLWRSFATLSHGEQTKVLLAALFLNEGHFLLIDEPTNHLDVRARALVSAYLKRKKGYILISHDRHVLDGCVDHILSLNRADIQVQSGNFFSWMENFQRQQSFEQAQNERLKKDIGRLQQAAQRSAVWSDRVEASKVSAADKGYVGHKAAKMMKRSKAMEARQQQAIRQKSMLLKNTETAEPLKLSPLTYHGDLLVSFSGVSVQYDGNAVCEPVSFMVRRGERVVLDGKNGSGKSSLLKLLLGEPIAHTGRVTVSSGLIISYVPQDASGLQGNLSEFARENQIEESLFKAILRKMDFERSQFDKDIREFSGGQKKKVLLARSLCQQAHLYVWDEPLNYIDIYSRMQMEQLLEEYAPAMVFVEHDQAFRDAVATKIVEICPLNGT
ncbi:ribosomal protection-like ABC-F family protein [Butyricicoccus sp.]|uniref:ribosomal protection-like ABC-F family protein n=1 Tax=Butyricicoccus sp. TaxID=2049021 RepID=UPI003F142D10